MKLVSNFLSTSTFMCKTLLGSINKRICSKSTLIKGSDIGEHPTLTENMASCLVGSDQTDCLTTSNHGLLIQGSKTLRWITSNQRNMTGLSPRPLVLCGPSGSGKSTLLKQLLDEFGELFGFSVSHTTRKPRDGEVNGKDYYFVDRKEMEQGIQRGDFIEFAEFSGNLYGTSKKSVRNIQEQGRICVLDIEMEGVKKIKKTNLNPLFIFIKPPSMNVLEDRLRGRGTDSEESIQKRLAKAQQEITFGETEGNFDLVLINDDVVETYQNLRNFLLQDLEELKKSKNS